ncbi:MAG TPA: hypothetical protein VFG32_13780, partial [Bacteroidota bacterium]|nr:hypothetical protein [Bacteroidota bacterium]
MRILGTLAVLLLAASVIQTYAQIPEQLSYQGVLTDTSGNPRPDGSYSMTFRLYTVVSGGSALWTEAKSVTVSDGVFTTYLGDTTPFPISITWSTTYWLSLQVGGDPELSPRIKLASVAYSLNPDSGGSQWQNNGNDIHYSGGRVFIGRDFPISGNEVFGVRRVSAANQYAGMYIEGTDPASWPFYGYATNGAFRAWTYLQPDSSGSSGPGWKLYLAGVRLTVPPTGGLRVGPSLNYSLVIENTTGSDGIRVLDTGDDAIQIGSNPDIPNYGVYIP